MKKILFGLLFLLGLASPALAAPDCSGAAISGMVIGNNGSLCYYLVVNSDGSINVTTTPSATPGHVIVDSGILTTLTTLTNPVGVKGADGSTISSSTNPVPVGASPAVRTIVTLDVKTVTTGGTAVTAIAAGHRTAGGFLLNPVGATINLCINEIGTATGTTSSGDTTCILPGQSYKVVPASTGVSVITSDSSHPFSGYGLN